MTSSIPGPKPPSNGSDGPRFADGARTKLAPQFYYYVGPLGFLGEYIASRQEVTRATNQKRDFDSDAWQLNVFWVVTGEDASFRNPTPRKPYAGSSPGLGAVELVGRYGVARAAPANAVVKTAANPAVNTGEQRGADLARSTIRPLVVPDQRALAATHTQVERPPSPTATLLK